MVHNLRLFSSVLLLVDMFVNYFISLAKLRVRLARCETDLSPPVNYFYSPFQGGASFVDHLCYISLVFVMLSCASVFLMPCGHLLGKG